MGLNRSVHLRRMNRKLSYRNWQFFSQKYDYPSKIPRNQFLRIIISFLEICSKINPQVSLHRSIRLILMNQKLITNLEVEQLWLSLKEFKKIIAFMYKNMYKLVTNEIASFSPLDLDEPEVDLSESGICCPILFTISLQ